MSEKTHKIEITFYNGKFDIVASLNNETIPIDICFRKLEATHIEEIIAWAKNPEEYFNKW